jgi:magnesium chelatase subunit D
LTDGRANLSRDGKPGRSIAEQDAVNASRKLRALAVSTLLIDTSPKPGASASRFADEMNAKYLALPYADAEVLSTAVKSSHWRSSDP